VEEMLRYEPPVHMRERIPLADGQRALRLRQRDPSLLRRTTRPHRSRDRARRAASPPRHGPPGPGPAPLPAERHAPRTPPPAHPTMSAPPALDAARPACS
jgi:hypothetical protein